MVLKHYYFHCGKKVACGRVGGKIRLSISAGSVTQEVKPATIVD